MTKLGPSADPVNQVVIDDFNAIGPARIGAMHSHVWYRDPRHLAFTLSRYKFVSKLLSGKKNVLEVGCGDGFPSRIVKQEVDRLTLIDFDQQWIDDAKNNMVAPWICDAFAHDIVANPVPGSFDAVYSIDVLEHIPPECERRALDNILASLIPEGVLIIGMPSLESQRYALPAAETGHVNCKSGADLKALLQEYFHNVFLFSMNDEVVHTGYSKMAHYLFCVCTCRI